MACCREPETAMPSSDAVACALKILGSQNQMFNKQCTLVTENREFGAYCASTEGARANYLGLESCEETSTSFFWNATFSSLPSVDPKCNEVIYIFM